MEKSKEADEKENNSPPEDVAGASSDKSKSEQYSGLEDVNKILTELQLEESTATCSNAKEPKKLLNSLNLQGIVEYIAEHKCRRIITMAGAGISTAAGIPDFRSRSHGLYDNLKQYNLPHSEAIFDIGYFMENPKPFFEIAKKLMPKHLMPTMTHYFIRMLWEKGLLLRHYTQNVDGLERLAGLPEEKIVEAHGTFRTGRCLKCRQPYTLEWMREKIFKDGISKCDKCSDGVVKPDIVFFGEQLPDRFYNMIDQDFPKADLLIIMGSSLVVQPFAMLVDRVSPTCPRLLINRVRVGTQDSLSKFLGLQLGFDPESDKSEVIRDVACIGDCDAASLNFAQSLGWKDELKAMYERERKELGAGSLAAK